MDNSRVDFLLSDICISLKYNRILLLIIPAVQTQAGWSFSEDVNFLASGYNDPASGSTGSGIYLGNELNLYFISCL